MPDIIRVLDEVAEELEARGEYALEAEASLLAESAPYMADDPTEGYIRSLGGLVKGNQGLWKSEKQGMFLYKKLRGNKFLQSDGVKKWARSIKQYNPTNKKQILIEWLFALGGYGKTDPSKVRYAANYYLIDGTGVLAMAKVKVHHPKGDDRSVYTMPNTATTVFDRPENVIPEVDVDPDKKQREQRKKNEPLIQKIKTVPGWEKIDILSSFLAQLERGYTLSPKQLAIVDKFLPEVFLDEVDYEEAGKMIKEMGGFLGRAMDRLFVQLEEEDKWQLEEDMKKYEKEEGSRWQGKKPDPNDHQYTSAKQAKEWWKEYKSGKFDLSSLTSPTIYSWAIRPLFREAGIDFYKLIRGSSGTQDGYLTMLDQYYRALPKLKKGKQPTKKAAQWLRIIPTVHEKMKQKMTPALVDKRWAEYRKD